MKRVMQTLIVLGVSAAIWLPCTAWSQAWPTKPIRLITEFLAGSGGDALLRVVVEGFSPMIGQPIIIENRAGAGGVVAAEAVARAAPDGYTLLGAAPNTQTVRVHLARSNPFDPAKDFTPLTALGEPTIVIIGAASFPPSNMKELLDYAKANPGKVSYATSGIGSSHHLSGEQIKMLTGTQIVHVPYKGLAEGLRDVAAGQIQIGFNLSGPSAQLIKTGKIKLLAIVNNRRMPEWPDTGTVNEAIPTFEKPSSWTGLLGPGNMPTALARRISAEAVKAINEPKTRARINEVGFNVLGNTPEEFAAQIKRETEVIGKIVKAAGIQPLE